MKLIGLMPVRNEDWVLGLSARVALMWCDELVILLHACTDQSRKIATDLAKEFHPRVTVVGDDKEIWDEMRHRQAMLEIARAEGATNIAIIDADEVLTGNCLPWMGICSGERVSALPRDAIMMLPGYNLRGGLCRYHNNGIWGRRWFSVSFRDSQDFHWAGDNFHHREPRGIKRLAEYKPIAQGEGGVMHLWGASERRLRAKHALYKVTERLRWPERPVADIDRMYSWAIHGERGMPYGTPKTWTYADVPAEWWAPYAHLMQYLHVDREPWQEQEVRRLVAEHGRELFRDLELFEVA